MPASIKRRHTGAKIMVYAFFDTGGREHRAIGSWRWPSLLRPSEARSGSLQQAEIGGWRTSILLYKALICMVLYVMVQVGWRCGLDFSP